MSADPFNPMPPYQPSNAMLGGLFELGPSQPPQDINEYLRRELEALERALIPNPLRRAAWKRTAGGIFVECVETTAVGSCTAMPNPARLSLGTPTT
jgi:hypothetical protein